MANPNPSPATRFEPGQSGNPGGKAAGARNRISGRFLNDLADDYERHGAAVIARVREESPVTYIKVVASLLPTKIETSHPLSDVSDEELDAMVVMLRQRIAENASASDTMGVDAHG